ncbi:MAG: putative ABC transporter permease [Candidatus Izemoplasma sp.]|nr:putative ABC transporter permease [Candidatus Izemoplasma sp.]
MFQYLYYLIVYSILGFLLERIINFIAYGFPYDNSVMIGPWQPLYGLGIVLAIIIYHVIIKKVIPTHFLRLTLLLVIAIMTTALSEAVTGYGYEALTNLTLWNYNAFFTCQSPYVCFVPTSLFGLGSFLTILFIHPYISMSYKVVPKRFIYLITILFLSDFMYTLFTLII